MDILKSLYTHVDDIDLNNGGQGKRVYRNSAGPVMSQQTATTASASAATTRHTNACKVLYYI